MRQSVLIEFAIVVLLAASQARGADRAETEAGPIRLIAGFARGDTVEAGLTVDLRPGWKTYWRTPGDVGVPPRVDLDEADNVASIAVDFPAPHRFGDAAAPSIGYEGRVTLPLRARLIDPARPATLTVKVFLGVCRDICIPVEETLSLVLGRQSPQPQAVAELVRARAAVPRAVPPGADLSVQSVVWDGGAADALIVEIKGTPADLFAEGPDSWALALPERIADADGRSRWRLSLAGLPPTAVFPGTKLRLTAVAAAGGTEQDITIPAR